MADAARELIWLAMERFGNLLPAEAKMLRAAAEGTVADVADQPGDEKLTRESAWGCWETWGEHRTIRSELLRWVLVDEEAVGLVHEHGVRVREGVVVGEVDLASAKARHVISWRACALKDGVVADRSRLVNLDLSSSHILHLRGTSAVVRSDIDLGNGCVVRSGMHLFGATVGGSIVLGNSVFHRDEAAEGSPAINLARARLKGSVYLNDEAEARGETRLRAIRVGGDLNLSRSRLSSSPPTPGAVGYALLGDGAWIGGSVFLNNGVVAIGEVRLRSAHVGAVVDCSGSTFDSPGGSGGGSGLSLILDGASVGSDVFLGGGLIAKGEVRLFGVSIGGDVSCFGGEFHRGESSKGDAGVAMRLTRANIAGSVLLRGGAKAFGELRLSGARIGGDLELCGEFWGEPDQSRPAVHAPGLTVSGKICLTPDRSTGVRVVVNGSARFVGAKIGGDFELDGLDCRGCLELNRSLVRSTLRLDDLTHVAEMIDLRDTRVARLRDSRMAWAAPSISKINGFRYGSFTDECDMTVEHRIEWIGRGVTNTEDRSGYPAEPYQQLARAYASMGRADDAIKVRQAQYRARREYEKPRSFWDISGALWYWWRGIVIVLLGCGYNRVGPLYAMLVLWLIGGLVFQAANRQGLMVPASDQVLTTSEYQSDPGRKLPTDYQPMNVWTYSADAMLPFIDLHQERFWLPKRDPDPVRWRAIANLDRGTVWGYPFPDAGRFLRWYLWFHIAAGWILSTLFVVGLSGIVKNEDGKSQDE